MNLIKTIQKQISDNPILLYMKGSPVLPSCGFSSQSVKILSKCIKSFSYVNVLEHPDIRSTLPKLSNWPTYPQLWIDSQLIGGCDIMTEMYRNQKLQELIKTTKIKYHIQENNLLNVKDAFVK